MYQNIGSYDPSLVTGQRQEIKQGIGYAIQ